MFSLFLATTMSISAMPVIAKILVDLDLTKRNIGLVILSAGVVDDTVGWVILSLISGAAVHGAVRPADLGAHRGLAGAFFLAGAAFVLYPLLRFAVRIAAEQVQGHDSDLVLVIAVTFLCAAADRDASAFTRSSARSSPGSCFTRCRALRRETIVRLESFTFSVLAPIFFGIVGLRVDLWHLGGGGMLLIVIVVACLGKLVGCSLGAYWGGHAVLGGASIAVAMNARGAMGIVVATIGLSLEILTPADVRDHRHDGDRDVLHGAARAAPDDAAGAHDGRGSPPHRGRRIHGRLRSRRGCGSRWRPAGDRTRMAAAPLAFGLAGKERHAGQGHSRRGRAWVVAADLCCRSRSGRRPGSASRSRPCASWRRIGNLAVQPRRAGRRSGAPSASRRAART